MDGQCLLEFPLFFLLILRFSAISETTFSMACVPSFPVNAFAFPEFITIAIGSSSFLDALFTTFFDRYSPNLLIGG